MNRPNDYYRDLAPKNVDDVLTSHTPAIAQIIRYNDKGPLIVRALLVTALHNLNEYFNVTKPLTEAQAVEIINLICERLPYYKLDDIKLLFNNIKVGKYGKNYNRIDGVVIFEAAEQYNFERMERAESLSIQRHNDLKKPLVVDPAEINEEGRDKIVAMLKETVALIESEKVEKPKSDRYVGRGRTEMDLFIGKCFTHWQRLVYGAVKDKAPGVKIKTFGIKNADGTPTRFIQYHGKQINQEEFINFKIEQYSRLKNYIEQRKKKWSQF